MHVKGKFFIRVGGVLVVGVLCQVILAGKERPDASKLQNVLFRMNVGERVIVKTFAEIDNEAKKRETSDFVSFAFFDAYFSIYLFSFPSQTPLASTYQPSITRSAAMAPLASR